MANVLIVDDEKPLRDSYSIILKTQGHNIMTAVHGKNALAVIKNFKPDVILLDIDMPVLDGIGFLRKANMPNMYPKCKIIVFTNLEETKRLDEAYKLGADRYVLKSSLAPGELIELVEDAATQS